MGMPQWVAWIVFIASMAALGCHAPDPVPILTGGPFDQRTNGVLHTFTFQPDGAGLHRQLGTEPDLLLPFRWTLTDSRLCLTYRDQAPDCGPVRIRRVDGRGEIEWRASGRRWVSRWPTRE